jgi:hypothetical protein
MSPYRRWYKGVGEIHMNKGRVGEERKGKEMERMSPYSLPSFFLMKKTEAPSSDCDCLM